MEKQYFIQHINRSRMFDPDVAILTKEGTFCYGTLAIADETFTRLPVPAEDIVLFTKEEAECIVNAFMDLFINGTDLCGEELSCHHISTLGETEDLAMHYMKEASMLAEEAYDSIGE